MGISNSLKLEVILAAVDKAVAPLKRIQAASQEATKELGQTRDKLKELQRQQSMLESYRAQQQAVKDTTAKLAQQRDKLEQLRAARAQDGAAADENARKLAAAEIAVKRLTNKLEGQSSALGSLRDRMRESGITNMADAQKRLAAETTATTAQLEAQRQKLAQLRDEHRRISAAKDKYDKTRSLGSDLTGAGASMLGASAAIGLPIAKTVRDFSSFEDAMLGVARQVPGAKDGAAKLTSVYDDVRQKVHELGREIPLTTNQIAEMVTAGARMEVGKGAKTPQEMVEQLASFVRNSAAMAIAFDAVPDEIAEQMGKVAKNFGIPVTAIGGLADAINYLDDNAISKGADIINVLNRISGVISTVKMSANDAAALGSTLLTLGDRPEVAATAINAITQKLAAATKGTKKFQQAVKEIGWNSAEIQQGMQTDATGTYLKLFDKLAKVAPDKRVGIMVELVGLDHSDTLAKLANGADEFRQQIKLANDEAAKGSMMREMQSRQQALSAQWVEAKNRVFELSSTLGESLKPALIGVMDFLNPIITGVSGWARDNQELVGVLMMLAGGLAVVLAVMGSLTLAIGTVLAPIALLNYGLVLMSVKGGIAAMGVGGLLLRLSAMVAAFTVGYAVGKWFAGLLDGWLTKIFGVQTSLGTFLYDVLNGQPQKWRQAGQAMMDGLAAGITGAWAAVKDAVGGAADATLSWFKQKLGIRSPSRVFIAAGAEIPAGAALGIWQQRTQVQRAALAMAASAAVALPSLSLAGGLQVQPAGQIAAGAAAAQASAGARYEIHIHQAPGQNAHDVARAVATELDRRERAAAARRRSSYTGD